MASEAKKIALDTSVIFAAKIISLLLGLVRLKFIAVYLGVNTFGIYTFAMYFVATFGIFFDVGLGQILTRDIAADKSRTSEYISSALYLKLILFAATSLVIAGATYLSHFDSITNWAVALSIFITGTTSMVTVFTGAFQAHRMMKLISAITIATDLLTSIVVIILLVMGYGLFGLMAGSAIVGFCVFFITIYVARKSITARIQGASRRLWKYLLTEGYPVAIGSLGITLYFYVTTALLKYISGNVTAGYYNAALKLIMILTVVPVSFTQVIYPFFAELHSSERQKLESVLNISVRYMYIVSIPIAVGTVLTAKKLITLLYTAAFLPTVPALQLLIVSSMVSYSNYVIYSFFPAIKKQQFTMYVTIPTGVIVAVTNYFLIPRFGLLMPAISLVAVEIVMFFSAYFYLKKLHYTLHLPKIFLKPIAACVPMVLTLVLTNSAFVLIQIPVAAAVYAVAFYLIGGITKEDRPILEKILPTPIKGKILRYI